MTGGDLARTEHLGLGETSQVIEFPPGIVLEAIDHVNVPRLCLGCGQVTAGVLPGGTGLIVQHGPQATSARGLPDRLSARPV